MPSFDDRLRRDLDSLGRPADPGDAMERIADRKRRLPRARRIQAATMAVVVLAATSGAGYALYRAFGIDQQPNDEPAPIPVPSSQFRNGRIAFVDFEGDDWDIFTMEPDGTDVQQITHLPGSESQPAWSENGERIAFVRHELPASSQGNVWVMDADGSNMVRVAEGFDSHEPTWSPDGSEIAFTRGNGRLFRVGVEGDAEPELLVDGGVGHPDWSPDGGRIVFTQSGISILDLSSGEITRVTSGDDIEPTWSPDGRFISFRRQICLTCSYEVFTVRADGTDLRRYTQDDHHEQFVSWSPDGRSILFERAGVAAATEGGDAAGIDGLWTVAVDGSGETQITSPGTAGVDPAWQPIPPVGGASIPAIAGLQAGRCVHSIAHGDFDGNGRPDVAYTESEGAPPCDQPARGISRPLTLSIRLADGMTTSTTCSGCLVLDAPDLNDDERSELLVQVGSDKDSADLSFYVLEAEQLRLVEIGGGAEDFAAGPAVFPLDFGHPRRPDYVFRIRGLRCDGTGSARRLIVVSADGPSHTGPFDLTETFFALEGSILRWERTLHDPAASGDSPRPFSATKALAICQ